MKIKQEIEDFKVNEIIKVTKSKEGDITYFWLTKRNWNTTRAIKKIARSCRVSLKRFGWAGNKDKFGVTKQLVSAWKVPSETLNKVNLKDIKITTTGKGNNRINLGDLKSNKFKLTVRDLTKEDIFTLNEQTKLINKYGIPNYFGEQRFGRGNTHLVGKEIIKGRIQRAVKLIITYQANECIEAKEAREYATKNWEDWSAIIKKMPKWFNIEKAILNHLISNKNDYAGAIRVLPKKNLKLYVHAYQSYLFNKVLSKLISESSKCKGLKIKNMNLAFPQKKFIIPETTALPGYETKFGKDRASNMFKRLLKRENVTLNDFKCKRTPELKSKGIYRDSRIKIKNIKVSRVTKDKLNEDKLKLNLSFELTSGSYATILIRSLFLKNPK